MGRTLGGLVQRIRQPNKAVKHAVNPILLVTETQIQKKMFEIGNE